MITFKTETVIQPDGSKAFLSLPEDWAKFDITLVVPKFREYLDEERADADAAALVPTHTFKTLVSDGAHHYIRRRQLWGTAEHLSAISTSKPLREAMKEGGDLLAAYHADIGQHEGLYQAYLRYKDSPEFATLTSARKKIIADTLLAFRLAGAGLGPEAKARLKAINQRQAEIRKNFTDNTTDAQESWTKHVSEAEAPDVLAGIPDDVKAGMKERAEKNGLEGYVVWLAQPTYLSVIDNAEHRPLREEMYKVFVTATSEFAPDPKLNNTATMMEILALSAEEAKLLGFANYGEQSLAPKMASSPLEVFEFLNRIAAVAVPKAREEFAELEAFAKTELGIEKVEPWDIRFASEKLRIARYSVSTEEVRAYFPESKVFAGLFRALKSLYGMEFKEDTSVSVWAGGVKFFRVYDENGYLRGGFYSDLYARAGKRNGAWMDECLPRYVAEDGVHLPVGYLNCNFTAPVGGKEGYLTHDDVLTVYHEFGHNGHLLFTLAEDISSGMGYVEWDAIELPSQFNENFAWDESILVAMSAHRETGASIPDELCRKMIAARNFQSAMQTVRQLEFAITDMRLYTEYDPANPRDPNDVIAEVRREVRVTPTYEKDRFLTGFNHIFAGGYSAGYYSYKWAEALSADVSEIFGQCGNVLDRTTGERFQREINGVGASRPMAESFHAFTGGRDVDTNALLRQTGLL